MDEFKIIEKYIKTKPDASVVLGAGDDCCIIEHSPTHYRITTSDALVEHKHFRLDDLSYEELGYKSLAVNLS
ncbi:MAG: thiamine-phosphate kinase, partial [Bdellovibrionales bacterium]|nr:hypothetical protein [Bdellovibrionales bacterium]NQZ18364.1 thiamine-phosphate kinase [Bdellovibrionales bacterium]